jgi:ribosomal protein S18 acetylase RimI-like enzyme
MDPSFRLASPADLEPLLAFARAFYADQGYPFDEPAVREVLAPLLADADLGRVWLIEVAAEAVGYVALCFGYSIEHRGRDAFVDELYVAPTWRGRGIGTAALHFAQDACPALGVRALHLEVERQNAAAVALYRKLGFAERDRFLMTRRIEDH